jgi:hypothetical protein
MRNIFSAIRDRQALKFAANRYAPPAKIPSIARLACSSCGAETDASCNCGAPYLPAGMRAAKAIAENPEKSDRAIAADIGVDHKTVGSVRAEAEANGEIPHKKDRRESTGRKARGRKANRSKQAGNPPDSEFVAAATTLVTGIPVVSVAAMPTDTAPAIVEILPPVPSMDGASGSSKTFMFCIQKLRHLDLCDLHLTPAEAAEVADVLQRLQMVLTQNLSFGMVPEAVTTGPIVTNGNGAPVASDAPRG